MIATRMTAARAAFKPTQDQIPIVATLVLALLPLFAMDGATWVVLTVAGLAMGMMIFLMASGLTLIFGLMDVLNFAHAAFITLGAFMATTVLLPLDGLTGSPSFWANLAAIGLAIAAAVLVAGALGWVFERVIIMRVYGSHLRQILITVGGLIVAEQMITVIWGADPIPLAKPTSLQGAFVVGDVIVEKYRLLACAVGVLVYLGMHYALNRTRIGLLVRAGVENREMVEALGYRIKNLFVGVFMAGTALAAVGGVMWAMYQELVTVTVGAEVQILVFIVIIIGGLGSVGGCFLGAILVGLTANYMGFLAPKLALGSNILLMAAVLMWRPRGLYPVGKA